MYHAVITREGQSSSMSNVEPETGAYLLYMCMVTAKISVCVIKTVLRVLV